MRRDATSPAGATWGRLGDRRPRGNRGPMPRFRAALLAVLAAAPLLAACGDGGDAVTLRWFVGQESSGAYREIAQRCTDASAGRYDIRLEPLPRSSDVQREQLVRRLAARDPTLDLIGLDVIWTAEFAEAGWLRPWDAERDRKSTRLNSSHANISYAV